MYRIIKSEGFIFLNTQSINNYCFYLNTSQSLAYWSDIQIDNIDTYPVKVIETFYIIDTETIFAVFGY